MFPRLSRRGFLQQAGLGIGGLALASLAQAKPHFAAKAKRVIWLYMDGGISHLDTFDPKPKLAEYHGKPFPMKIEATQFDSGGPTLKSPWKTKQHGQSGLWISELFPHLAQHADKLAVLRSMTNESAIHATANYWMHTGWGQMGRPSCGAWVNYGLGSEAENLPGFVVLNGGLLPIGGVDNYKSGFLPASHGPTFFDRNDPAVPNIQPAHPARQRQQLDAILELDRSFAKKLGQPDAVESGIRNYELAAKLQTSVPDLLDLAQETQETKKLYGFDSDFEHTRTYARQCLLARRLVERNVRFVSLTVPRVMADTRWDAHGELKKNHDLHAKMVDQPIAGLLTDLARKGLMKDVLVVFTTEFGRTPFTQGTDGRDHNQYGFSSWLAGAGVKGGMTYGATDEFGYKVVEKKLLVHDFHATILHLLGLDHEKLTYRFGGRDYRLTDVHGHVAKEVVA
ncbi:MAG: DUF1501 domain-containing protein [Fimbriiglobus sp.]